MMDVPLDDDEEDLVDSDTVTTPTGQLLTNEI